MSKKTKYTTVHIPVSLAKLIDDLINDGTFAYSSRSEFVKDALRRFLETYGCYPPHSSARVNPETSAFLNLAEVEEEKTRLKNHLHKRISLLQKAAKSLEADNK